MRHGRECRNQANGRDVPRERQCRVNPAFHTRHALTALPHCHVSRNSRYRAGSSHPCLTHIEPPSCHCYVSHVSTLVSHFLPISVKTSTSSWSAAMLWRHAARLSRQEIIGRARRKRFTKEFRINISFAHVLLPSSSKKNSVCSPFFSQAATKNGFSLEISRAKAF